MAIEPLLDALGSDAERDVHAITDAALAEAARIKSEAEAGVAQRCAAALEARETELRAATDARRARALRAARDSVLRARDAFLDRVFAAAAAELPGTLDRPDHAGALARLVHEALQYAPPDAVIRCRDNLAAQLHDNAGALGWARVVSADDVGEGIVVVANDGSVAIDNTLENRLRWLRPALSIDVLARFESAA